MLTVSGLILDYYTDFPVQYCTVVAINASGVVLGSGVSNPAGFYTITGIADSPLQNITYFVDKTGYKTFSRTLTNRVAEVSLHVQKLPTSRYINVSGTGQVTLDSVAFITSSNIRKVKDTPTHWYALTDDGVDIVDRNTFINSAYILYSGGFTCISLDERACAVSGIQLGSSLSGVYQFKILDYDSQVNKNITSTMVVKYATNIGQGLTSNTINCIDRNTKAETLIGTVSGVDFYNVSGVRTSNTFTGAIGVTACAVSEDGDLYYSPTNSGLYVKYAGDIDWPSPDYVVNLGSAFPISSNYINDIKVTSVSGANIIFLATASGLLYYQESRSNLNISASGAKVLNKFP